MQETVLGNWLTVQVTNERTFLLKGNGSGEAVVTMSIMVLKSPANSWMLLTKNVAISRL